MTRMNPNANIPKAPQAPALKAPAAKPAGVAKPAGAAKPATVAAAKAQLKPTGGPRPSPNKPGAGQESIGEATKNGRKPGGTLKKG